MEWFLDAKKIIKGGSVFFLGTSLVSLLAYGFHLFAGRFLSVTEYGELQTLIALQNMALAGVSVLALLLIRITAEYKKNETPEKVWGLKELLQKWMFFPGLLFLILFFLAIPFLKDFFKIDSGWAFFLLGISFYLASWQSFWGSFLNGWQEFFQFNLGNVVNGSFKFVVGLIFMAIGWGVVGGLLGIALGFFLQFLLNSYFVKKTFFQKKDLKESEVLVLNWKKVKVFWLEAYPIFLGILGISIFSNGDFLIAKHHFNQTLAGEYGALSILSKMIFFAVGSFSGLVVPIITAEMELKKKKRAFLLILLAGFGLAFSGVAFFYFFPKIVVGLLFGKEYLNLISYLAKFGFLALLLSLLNLFIQYFIALKSRWILLMILLMAFLQMVGLWFWGRNFADFFGIIFGFLLTANFVCGIYFWKKKMKLV